MGLTWPDLLTSYIKFPNAASFKCCWEEQTFPRYSKSMDISISETENNNSQVAVVCPKVIQMTGLRARVRT